MLQTKGIQRFLSVFLSCVMICAVMLPVMGTVSYGSDWTMYRHDEKRTGISNLTSNIVDPSVKWSFLTGGAVQSPPAVGDINNDGEMEVVFGSNDHHLYALDRFGLELWNFSTVGPVVCSPTIGDVDGDGLNEIVFGGLYNVWGDPNLYVLNGEDGSLIWQFESGKGGGTQRGFQASPLLHDINGDSIKDILVGSMDHYFYAFNGPNGSVIWQSDVFEHFVRSSSPIGDLDKDGEPEIVVIDNHAVIRSYDAASGLKEWENDVGHTVEATPLLADFDGDGYDEISVFTRGGLGHSGNAYVLNHDGTILWNSSLHTYFYTSPSILDIDGDGHVDIIGGDTDDHTIVAYKGTDGTILWETVLPYATWSQAPLVTADIDSDGVLEVIAGANPDLYCIDAMDGTIEWIFDTTGHIWGQPIVADLEKDGLAEVIFGCYDNYLYVLENANTPPEADAGEDQTVFEGETVQFDGSGSLDPDGGVLSYEWDFDADTDSDLDGNPANDIDATGPNPTHIYGDNGNFTVILTVTDGTGLSDSDTCIVTVLNVGPAIEIESVLMEVEIGLRIAGSKWSNVGITLYEDDIPVGYLEVERWPGNPDENPTYEDPSLPALLGLSETYRAVVTYDPYPDSGDEIRGDQPNNGNDEKDNAGNPVWLVLRFPDGSEEKTHHTFNTQQSMIRDSGHHNHVEPWEVELNELLTGHEFEVLIQITDPGSDDEELTYNYGSQGGTATFLNNPPNPDPFPSPQVSPVDISRMVSMTYEGNGTITVNAEDDDGGEGTSSLDIG